MYFCFAPEVQQGVTSSEERPGRTSCGAVKVAEFYFSEMLLGTSPPLILITAHQGALRQQKKNVPGGVIWAEVLGLSQHRWLLLSLFSFASEGDSRHVLTSCLHSQSLFPL